MSTVRWGRRAGCRVGRSARRRVPVFLCDVRRRESCAVRQPVDIGPVGVVRGVVSAVVSVDNRGQHGLVEAPLRGLRDLPWERGDWPHRWSRDAARPGLPPGLMVTACAAGVVRLAAVLLRRRAPRSGRGGGARHPATVLGFNSATSNAGKRLPRLTPLAPLSHCSGSELTARTTSSMVALCRTRRRCGAGVGWGCGPLKLGADRFSSWWLARGGPAVRRRPCRDPKVMRWSGGRGAGAGTLVGLVEDEVVGVGCPPTTSWQRRTETRTRASGQGPPKAVVVTTGVRHGRRTAVAHGPPLTGRTPLGGHMRSPSPRFGVKRDAQRGAALLARRRSGRRSVKRRTRKASIPVNDRPRRRGRIAWGGCVPSEVGWSGSVGS